MVRGEGRLPASKIKTLYKERIESFGLDFDKHIINSSNDGCSTMILLGKLMDILMQLCLAHGVQLAILKVFYILVKKLSKKSSENVQAFEDEDVDEESVDDGKIFLIQIYKLIFVTRYLTSVRYLVTEENPIFFSR